VVSYAFWKEALGGADDVVGQTVGVEGVPFTISGVTGRDYFNGYAAVMLPMAAFPVVIGAPRLMPETQFMTLIGRLGPGVTLEQAQDQVTMLSARLPAPRQYEADHAADVQEMRWMSPAVLQRTVGSLGMLANATALILLIAAANVGILLLSRAVARRSEIGVRLAIGAARSRLVRQLLTEGMMLSLLAAGVGLLMLTWLNDAAKRLFFPMTTFSLDVSWMTVAATVGIALCAGLVFAVAPAFHATRSGVMDSLKSGGGSVDPRGSRLQHAFVIAEVALSMALVCTAGIFVDASLRSARRADGYSRSPQIAVADLRIEDARYTIERKQATLSRVIPQIAALPGVAVVSHAHMIPDGSSCCMASLVGAGYVDWGVQSQDTSINMTVSVNRVGPRFFEALGVPLLAGRDFALSEAAGGRLVAIVDELTARNHWRGANPIDGMIAFRQWSGVKPDTSLRVATVIGVAPVIPEDKPSLPRIYVADAQIPAVENTVLIVRTADGPAAPLIPQIAGIVLNTDRRLPVASVKTMAQIYREQHPALYRTRTLAGVSGAVALILACVGIYATISFSLSRRIREIGIRRALGADNASVVYTFFEQGMWLAMIGFAIGVPASLAFMKIVVAEEFGVQMLTSSSIAMVLGALLAVCAFASWLPARRAAGVDALSALQHE
jgi:predicted permease